MSGSEPVEIRKATADDFDDVLRILNEITAQIKTKPGWFAYQVNQDKDGQSQIFKNILASDSLVLVAKLGGKVAGVANVQMVKNIRHGFVRAHIEEFSIDMAYRGHGLGTKLMKAVFDECKKRDVSVVKLMCGNQLTEAQAFYEAMGFVCKDKGYRYEDL
jgi:ribosomal protein S18 acetylase RimI-like enzyme